MSSLKCLRCGGPAVRIAQTGELSCVRQCKEEFADFAHRVGLEGGAAALARLLASKLPESTGFCLVLFDYGGKGSMAYASTGKREDTLAMLRELLGKMGAEGEE